MKKRISTRKFYHLLAIFFFTLFSNFDPIAAIAESNCEIGKVHGQGYSTSIKSVTDLGSNRYTIVLDVKQNGTTANCKAMARYSVEALPGTYSNVSIKVISGNLNYKNIDLGPTLSGDPFKGFRITSTAGFGNGTPGEFTITYSLSRGLQNQRTMVKAGSDMLLVSFKISDFQSVLNCLTPQSIFPYYTPPSGGKLVSILGPELTSLYNYYIAGGTLKTNDIFQIFGSDVLVEINVLPGQYASLLGLLTTTYGLYDVVQDTQMITITGKIPILKLLSLNSLTTYINFVRPVYLAIPTSGIVTSLGDVAMRSDFARHGFNLQGEGVKIGVISDSYNTITGNPAQDDVLKGDLPGIDNPINPNPVEVVLEYPYGTRSDEGRAMLQIVHDIAPKAKLAFRTGFINAPDFAQGITDLKNAGCNIIVDDITYITQPFLTDGFVAQKVNEVKSQGVAYFSAAGNYGNKSYQSSFVPGTTPTGISGVAHSCRHGFLQNSNVI